MNFTNCMIGEVLKISGLLLISATKFLFAPETVLFAGYSYWQTIGITITGGWAGVIFFFYFSSFAVDMWRKIFHGKSGGKKKERKRFSWRNRFIVKVKTRYGLTGLAFLTPCILSIPVGCFLSARYFAKNKFTVPVLLISVVFWAFALTSAFTGIF